MARARLVKPGLFTNDVLAALPIHARFLFIGLWTIADREGRLEDRPARIHAELYPYDKKLNVDALLGQLHESGFIARYESCGIQYIQVSAFKRHQSPHPKEPPSRIPAMGEQVASNGLVSDSPPFEQEQDTEETVSSPSVAVAGSSEAVAEAEAIAGSSADPSDAAFDRPRKRPLTANRISEFGLEFPDFDVPKAAKDYLNYGPNLRHVDQVQGFRNQLEDPTRNWRFRKNPASRFPERSAQDDKPDPFAKFG